MDKKEIIIRGIKIVDITYIYLIYFVIALLGLKITTLIIKYTIGKTKKEEIKKKTTLRLVGEVLYQLVMIGIFLYIMRNIVDLIPFPLNGVYGFEHRRVTELKTGGVVVMLLFVSLQYGLLDKIKELHDRLPLD